MRWLKKIRTFALLPIRVKFLFAEAFITSAWVKLCLVCFPFKRVLGWLGSSNTETESEPDEQTLLLRRNIKSALQLCKKYAPWPTECYTMALTGKLLLRRRNINSTLYIGFKKSPEGKYMGHAWLRSKDTYISGYRESIGYAINLRFS